jgi:PAS domain-containing protein
MATEAPEIALTRELAARLAVAVFVVDPDGNLLYYNPPAGAILGRRFEETGGMTLAQWSTLFEPAHESGAPLLPGSLPLVVALRERRPAHRAISIRGGDGRQRRIEITALPLLRDGTELLGAAALFWELPAPAGGGRD